MLNVDDTVLVLVDVQEKLASVMHEKELLFDNLEKLVKGMKVLDVPIVWMEQIPDKMGSTVPQLKESMEGDSPISKSSFSCCGEESFVSRIKSIDRKQVLLAGIESHVCVYQTASDLLAMGYEVEVVSDAVSSRTASNKLIGLEKAKSSGAAISGVETVLFELLKDAKNPQFKEILKLVK